MAQSAVSHSRLGVRRARGRRRLRRRGIATIAALVIVSFLLIRHAQATMTDNGHRTMAERITRAVIGRDLTPVMKMFPAASAGDMAGDVRIGALADYLSALGNLREVRFAGAGTLPDTQIFVATFTKGIVREQLSFDGPHVIGFTLLPSASKS